MLTVLIVFPILTMFFHREKIFEQLILPLYAVSVIVCIVLFAVWWRCPHCGKHLGPSFRDINYCPHCSKELDELYDE